MSELSVVVPYYNERKVIKNTFKSLINQSYKPYEILFINSSSTDSSFNIIEKLILSYKGNINLYNINTNCKTPSDAKNYGIKKSNSTFIAFMDCDMIFSEKWLEKQINFIKKNKILISFGNVCLYGKNIIDICSVIHTYGYGRKVPCIPSSIIHKSVFEKDNLFENYNALYDQKWIKKNIRSSFAKVNKNTIIKYLNINYASSYKELYNKVYYYSLPTIKIYGLLNKDVILIVSFLLILFFYQKILVIILPVYLVLRNIIFPILKSKKLNIFSNIKFRLDVLVISSFIIDFAKITGVLSGVLKKKISHYQR